MSEGKICAWHYRTRLPIRLRWREGRIVRLENAPDAPANLWLAPALTDIQVNGYGGVDFQSDTLSAEELLGAIGQLQAAGCGSILLTLVTDEWPRMLERLRRVHKLRAENPVLQSAIAGWHVEGPFLSPEPGFCGAHDPARMSDPSPERMSELRAAAENDALLLTLAPERPGALEAIAAATALGIRVSLGHTNASAAQLSAAVVAGAAGFTHLGNGCPQQLDRHDNILWRVFDTRGLAIGAIPDTIHVSPAFFRAIHRQFNPELIYYTTDAVAPAGAPPGEYSIGGLKVQVGPDQVVRQPGRTNFAGSALRPIDGVLRAVKMLEPLYAGGPVEIDPRRLGSSPASPAPSGTAGEGNAVMLADFGAHKSAAADSWQRVWQSFSVVPRRLAGLEKDFAVDKEATFCLLQRDEQLGLVGGQIYVRGEEREILSTEFPGKPA